MSRSVRYVIAALVVLVLLVGSFSGGVIVGWALPNGPVASLNPAPVQPAQASPDDSAPANDAASEELFAPFWEAWKIVHNNFVDQPVDDVALMRGAIRGMISALQDQHSSYMDPAEYEQATDHMDGQYGGIGAWVDITGEYLVITSPMPDSPAANAGLKPGDVIIKVDGEDMTGVDGNLVLQRVKGQEGTQVVLTIRRESQAELIEVTITRAIITVPSVVSEMLDNQIAYLQLFTYGENSTQEVKRALRELMAQKPRGLILDLRYNGGGYLNAAVEITSQFVGDGVILYEEYGDGRRVSFKSIPGGLATKIPLVVLVNEGTASASEITAGAIQDAQRGMLVGVTTYGKGSVQIWTPLKNDQGAVRITTARWITPAGRRIHQVGLQPDYEVEITEADIAADLDPQLEKAIELLTQ